MMYAKRWGVTLGVASYVHICEQSPLPYHKSSPDGGAALAVKGFGA